MAESPPSMIKVGISSCLLGERVRFDSGHKRNDYVTGVLQDYFEFVPFCPEVEIGLGIPREAIRLIAVGEEVRCVGTKNPELDVTQALDDIADKQGAWQEQLCGYILKKDSPSCGMERVKVYSNGLPTRNGVGIYAKRLLQKYPSLPVEEEGRLQDARLRENFIQRVFIYARWQSMLCEGLSLGKLQAFHAQHKYLLMSHNQVEAKALGGMLAEANKATLDALAPRYLERMMVALKTIATRENHVNTLQHIQGYLKKSLDAGDKVELVEVVENYKRGLVPLIVPITLLRHHFRRHPDDYITQSYYMNPHPGELMLLNNV